MWWEKTALPAGLPLPDTRGEAGCGIPHGVGPGRVRHGSAQAGRELNAVQPWGVQAVLGDPWGLWSCRGGLWRSSGAGLRPRSRRLPIIFQSGLPQTFRLKDGLCN